MSELLKEGRLVFVSNGRNANAEQIERAGIRRVYAGVINSVHYCYACSTKSMFDKMTARLEPWQWVVPIEEVNVALTKPTLKRIEDFDEHAEEAVRGELQLLADIKKELFSGVLPASE